MAGQGMRRAGHPRRLCGAATAIAAALVAPGCNKVDPAADAAPAELTPFRATSAVAQPRPPAVIRVPTPSLVEPRGAPDADQPATAIPPGLLPGGAEAIAMAPAEVPFTPVPDPPSLQPEAAEQPLPTAFATSSSATLDDDSALAIAQPADFAAALPREAAAMPDPAASQTSAASFENKMPASAPLAAVVNDTASPAPAEIALAATARDTSPAYVSQISDEVRAAYIAQVDAALPAQRLAVRSGDTVLGTVEFQVADGAVSVKIGQVLDLFEGGMEQARFAELRHSHASQQFVSLERIQAAGIPLEYNAAYDELTLDPGRG